MGKTQYKKGMKKTCPRRRIAIALLLVFGFCAVEFPGILLVGDKVSPFIFGMPFLYGYLICCWIYICLVLCYAWKTRWGKQPFFKRCANPPSSGTD